MKRLLVYVAVALLLIVGWRVSVWLNRRQAVQHAELDKMATAAMNQAQAMHKKLVGLRLSHDTAVAVNQRLRDSVVVAQQQGDSLGDVADSLHALLGLHPTDSTKILLAENTVLRRKIVVLTGGLAQALRRGDSLETDGQRAWASVDSLDIINQKLQTAVTGYKKQAGCHFAFGLFSCPSRGTVAAVSAVAGAALTATLLPLLHKAEN